MKTSDCQALASANWRKKMIDDGYVWKSAFIPKGKIEDFKKLLAMWKAEHNEAKN